MVPMTQYHTQHTTHALGTHPQPPLTPREAGALPMLYVPAPRETPQWEYRLIVVDLREEEPLDEAHLSDLGKEGWLLASVVQPALGPLANRLFYYFVRSA
jgi:hypothetical protein